MSYRIIHKTDFTCPIVHSLIHWGYEQLSFLWNRSSFGNDYWKRLYVLVLWKTFESVYELPLL